MQKQAPSAGRLFVAVGFALSCFGLLLFLWVAFGGPIPFAGHSYRFTADFPEATALAIESDVRVGGVSVGKVKQISLPPTGNATRATIELEPEFAPLTSDAKAILRQKTLLGETYIELTTGGQSSAQSGSSSGSGSSGPTSQNGAVDVKTLVGADAANPIPEGGHLAATQTQDATQIDEIFNALDKETRTAFQQWQQNAAIAIKGRGLDLNDAFGNLGPFAADATNVLAILDRQKHALGKLVRSTGIVFGALGSRERELAGAITGSNATFGALASQNQALADTFQILPTFQRESRVTLIRLDQFAHNTEPLVNSLLKVAPDISPTLHSVRLLAPNLEHLFRSLGPLIDASCGVGSTTSCSPSAGLASLRSFLHGLTPVLKALDPFLANLNPIVRYVNFYKSNVSDFLASPGAGLAGTLEKVNGQAAPRHVLRQISYTSAESLTINPQRLDTNRGNGYLTPGAIGNPNSSGQFEVFPSFDCKNTGATGGLGNGQITYNPLSNPAPHGGEIFGGGEMAPCTLPPNFPATFGGDRAPQVFADP